ncbi:hypothetical protein [Thermomonospora amylolytica]|uniref:hypothetical protein n=1 Tax=Thermomonospora amylolytica TaxID=1411117 RepID=UPI001300B1E0|nr:hypothetical protein [Thermomonospora amylolytica]
MMTTNDDRRRALDALAATLRGQKYRVTVAGYHLTADEGTGRTAEVWVQRRASDNGRLWYTGPDNIPICEVNQIMDAVVAVKRQLADEAVSSRPEECTRLPRSTWRDVLIALENPDDHDLRERVYADVMRLAPQAWDADLPDDPPVPQADE